MTYVSTSEEVLRGPKGDRGSMGFEGPRGPKGERGEKGEKGDRGAIGLEGEKGDRGPTGIRGPKGERGAMGLEGERGLKGPKGDRGPAGNDGKDGKDADQSLVLPIVTDELKKHESQFDHSNIDPYLIGSKKLSEAGMSAGMFLKYDGENIVYETIKDISSQISKMRGGGTALPQRTGNVGKVLKVASDLSLEWGTVSGTGDVVGPASATDGNFASFDTTTGKLIEDSTYSPSSFAAALGADDNYVTDAEKVVIGNTSGTNTGDQNLFRTIAVSGQSDVVADSTTDTLTLVAGSNISITTNAGTDTITITGTGGGGSGITRSVNVISTPTTAGATAATDYVYLVSGTTTLTMPTAVGNTNRYSVKNTGVATVTVAFDGVETGDGSTTLSILPNVAVDLISNGSNFFIL